MPTALRPLLLCVLAALPLAAHGAEPATPRPPDARRGEALYVGSTPLFAGGAPCLACHGIAGHGLERAASFAPDLSAAHEQFGAEALDAMLVDIAFPSMEPVYRGHAVTDEERGDLIAFLAESTGGAPAKLGTGYVVGVAAAMAAFLAVVLTIGRRGSVRHPRAATSRGGTP